MDSVKAKANPRMVAEKSILIKDYIGARETILRAREFFPGLENAAEMLAVCDVLCAADLEFPVCGIDWYWVLQLPPSVDDLTIATQYKKLTALIKPMINKFEGAESAMKILNDAFSVLSDKSKRVPFDSKRSASRNDGECWVSVTPDDSELHMEEDGSGRNKSIPCLSMGEKIGRDETYDGGDPMCISKDLPSKRQRDLGGASVVDWMDHAFTSMVSNAAVENAGGQDASWISTTKKSRGDRADSCREEVAVSMDCKLSDESPSLSPISACRKRPAPDFFHFEDNTKLEHFAAGQIWAAYDTENMPRYYAQIAKIVSPQSKLYITCLKPEPKSMNEKSWLEAGFPFCCGSFSLKQNELTQGSLMQFSHMLTLATSLTTEQFEIYPKEGEVWAIYRNCSIQWCSDPGLRNGCEYEMVEILSDYSIIEGVRVAYLMRVDGFRNIFQRYISKKNDMVSQIPATKLFVFSHNVPSWRFKGGEMVGISKGMLELDPSAVPNNLVQDFSYVTPSSVNLVKQPAESKCNEPSSITQNLHLDGLDSGTQCYKRQWAAEDFLEEQVWAVYNGPDNMPRSYIKVSRVIPGKKVSVTYLEPHSMQDDQIRWIEEELPSVCGIFRLSRATADLEMSKFSHLVKCDRSTKRSFYKIYPRKGEIWAMYNNWHTNWHLSDLDNYQCEVVEILSDFDEEQGTIISLLVQVKGFMTFFERKTYEGFDLTRTVTRKEMLRFSHRIPAYMVLGVESYDIPKNSWHLEPDALPSNLRS
ncbi:hypothetical protein ACLOJK_019364 [Asimina triloba]